MDPLWCIFWLQSAHNITSLPWQQLGFCQWSHPCSLSEKMCPWPVAPPCGSLWGIYYQQHQSHTGTPTSCTTFGTRGPSWTSSSFNTCSSFQGSSDLRQCSWDITTTQSKLAESHLMIAKSGWSSWSHEPARWHNQSPSFTHSSPNDVRRWRFTWFRMNHTNCVPIQCTWVTHKMTPDTWYIFWCSFCLFCRHNALTADNSLRTVWSN